MKCAGDMRGGGQRLTHAGTRLVAWSRREEVVDVGEGVTRGGGSCER